MRYSLTTTFRIWWDYKEAFLQKAVRCNLTNFRTQVCKLAAVAPKKIREEHKDIQIPYFSYWYCFICAF